MPIPEEQQVRIQYGYADSFGAVPLAREYPGKMFACIGPFDDSFEKAELQRAIENVLRRHNGVPEK